MSRPIPRRLLPHKIVWSKLIDVDDWGRTTYEDGVTISYVRHENLKKNLINSLGESKDDKATLFVDARNSEPIVSYSKGDKITFNDNEYTIREIDQLCGDSEEMHHLEIALV